MSQTFLVAILGILFYLSSLLGGHAPNSDWNGTNPPDTTFTSIGYVKDSPATLREGPGTDQTRLSVLEPESSVEILDETNGWYQVRTESGDTGWVAGMLIQSGAALKPGNYEVMGYYMGTSNNSSLQSLQRHHTQMTKVIPWAFSVTATGDVVNATPTNQLADLLKMVGENTELETLALISNYDQKTHKFSPEIASSVLRNPRQRSRAIANITKTLENWGVSGVNIDFEHVPPRDRDYYTLFIKELSEQLRPKGLSVTVAIPAKTYDDPNSNWSGAFDYAQIGRYADYVVLMAYDQHWTGGDPGPIASAQWVEQVVKYAVSQIPRQKVILGVPGYGYAWSGPGKGATVNYESAVRIANTGSGVQWDEQSKTPYANAQDREIWFENAASLGHKLDIVTKYGVKGIALWRLGQEDPNSWRVISAKL